MTKQKAKCINVDCDEEKKLVKIDWPSKEYPTYFCDMHLDSIYKKIKSLREWMALKEKMKRDGSLNVRSRWHRL